MDSVIGIPPTYLGLLGIFTGVVVIVLSIGWMYDVIFSLWRAHQSVIQERNPYTTYMLNGPVGAVLAQTNEILKRLSNEDEEILKHTEFVDRWLEWNGQQELWNRTIDGLTEVMGENDPVMLHIDNKGES